MIQKKVEKKVEFFLNSHESIGSLEEESEPKSDCCSSVEISQTTDQTRLHQIIRLLEEIIEGKKVKPQQPKLKPTSSCTQINEHPKINSASSQKKSISCLLTEIQTVLLHVLQSELPVISVFFTESKQQEDKIKTSVKCLEIFYDISSMNQISAENQTQFLTWVYYFLTILKSQANSYVIIGPIKAISKLCIKIGFSILYKYHIKETTSKRNIQDESQEEFMNFVEKFIEEQKNKVEEMKFQICRVCQKYILINCLKSHLNTCQKNHQIKYCESKLLEKGKQLLDYIKKIEDLTLKSIFRQFFDKIYENIGEFLVIFKLQGIENLAQINIIIQSENISEAIVLEISELLKNYKDALTIKEGGDRHSDDDCGSVKIKSKGSLNHSKLSIPYKHSNSFIDFEGTDRIISSEKTIQNASSLNVQNYQPRFSLQDLEIIKILGKGSYSQVYLVRKTNTQDLYAMKVIEIEKIGQENLQIFKQEQKVYKNISGEFNVKLYYSFIQGNLYFLILDYASGGNLRQLLEKEVYIEEKSARFYIANLSMAVNFMHELGIIHRDLKPENIVIDDIGHLVLTDFNLAKMIGDKNSDQFTSFFGTPDYIAPEVIQNQSTNNQMRDWFSVGVIAYEILIGVTPFTDMTEQQVFQNILKGEIQWPEIGLEAGMISPQCKHFLQRMLDPHPETRLGANGIDEIQNHPFFTGFNFNKLQQESPFYFPQCSGQRFQQNMQLRRKIEKLIDGNSSIQSTHLDTIVRYDILKNKTNKNLRSKRNSRFKIEKELQILKEIMPSAKFKTDNSFQCLDELRKSKRRGTTKNKVSLLEIENENDDEEFTNNSAFEGLNN